MGVPVLILGESGSGKSASMRNFKPGEIGIINVSGKPLPFRNNLKTVNTDNYEDVVKTIIAAKAKALVIDDAQYLMANEFMRTAKITGYQKFTDLALNFWRLIQVVINNLPPDKIVYFLAHVERDANGNEKMKTIGKMLDEKITVEGMFSIVLKTVVNDGNYYFQTQNSGKDTCKSPIGLFNSMLIENDLKKVDNAIRDYYDLSEAKAETPTPAPAREPEPEPEPVKEKTLAEKVADFQNNQPGATMPEAPKADVTTPAPVETADATPVRRRRRIVE